MWDEDCIRLIGLRLDKLVSNVNYQGSLFDDAKNDDKVDEVVDSLKKKFGSRIINKASLLNNKEKRKLDLRTELKK